MRIYAVKEHLLLDLDALQLCVMIEDDQIKFVLHGNEYKTSFDTHEKRDTAFFSLVEAWKGGQPPA